MATETVRRPFTLGDSVFVTRGPHKGKTGTIVNTNWTKGRYQSKTLNVRLGDAVVTVRRSSVELAA